MGIVEKYGGVVRTSNSTIFSQSTKRTLVVRRRLSNYRYSRSRAYGFWAFLERKSALFDETIRQK